MERSPKDELEQFCEWAADILDDDREKCLFSGTKCRPTIGDSRCWSCFRHYREYRCVEK